MQRAADARLGYKPETLVEFGACPLVKCATGNEWALLVFDFTVDEGHPVCSGPATAGRVCAGNLAAIMARHARVMQSEFCGVTIAGHAVTGSIDGPVTGGAGQARLAATCNFGFGTLATIAGGAQVDYADNGPLTLAAGVLDLGGAGADYAVSVDGVRVAPIQRASFVPEGGTASFELPAGGGATRAVVVTFSAQSPVDGTVWVSVDGAAVAYRVPGAGW